MAKLPKDPQGIEFQLRPGDQSFGGQGWRGIETESDPGSLDPNQLQWAENVRFKGKTLISRPGLINRAKLSPNFGLNDTLINWMKESPVANPSTRLWLMQQGCTGTSGSTLSHFDPAQNPKIQIYSRFIALVDFTITLAALGDDLYAGVKSTLRRMERFSAEPGVSWNAKSPTNPASVVKDFTGFTITAMAQYDSKLFIALSNNSAPGSSKIVTYDGLTFRDDLTGVRPCYSFGFWRNQLIAGFDATAAHIRTRVPGSSPGTWTTVALAGFLTSPDLGNAMQEVGPYTYIASGAAKLFKYDGTSLTLERTIAGCSTAGLGLVSLTLHNGLLYYGWNTVANNSQLGRHDPDSTSANEYIDTYKDITSELPNFNFLRTIASYRGQIWCTGEGGWFIGTAVNEVKGTLFVVFNAGTGVGFPVTQLLKF